MATAPNICFINIFNHRFEQNVPLLEKMYGERFRNRYYIMPFYDGHDRRVIGVYENSHFFQGYIAQAFPRVFSDEYTHYVFCADDLVLNPAINEENILRELEVEGNCAYIKNLTALSEVYFLWIFYKRILEAFDSKGVHFSRELPDAQEANAAMARHGIAFRELSMKNLRNWHGKLSFHDFRYHKGFPWRSLYLLRRRPLPYPLVAAYSDFFVLPAKDIRRFVHLCGIFASMNLWVETAIPTAMAITSDRIVTELALGKNWMSEVECLRHEKVWRGLEIWKVPEVETFAEQLGYDLQRLSHHQQERRLLYVHPVKLSKWH